MEIKNDYVEAQTTKEITRNWNEDEKKDKCEKVDKEYQNTLGGLQFGSEVNPKDWCIKGLVTRQWHYWEVAEP